MDDDLISEKPFNNYTFNMRLFGFAKNIVVAWWFLVSISVTNAGQWRVDDSVPQPEFKKQPYHLGRSAMTDIELCLWGQHFDPERQSSKNNIN